MLYKQVRCELRSVGLRIVIRRIFWISRQTDSLPLVLKLLA